MCGGDVVEYVDGKKDGITFARYALVVHSAMLPDARPGEAPRPDAPVAEHLTLLVLESEPDPAMHGLFHLGKQIYGRVLAAVPPLGCGRGIGWQPIFPERLYRHPALIEPSADPSLRLTPQEPERVVVADKPLNVTRESGSGEEDAADPEPERIPNPDEESGAGREPEPIAEGPSETSPRVPVQN